MSKRKRSKQKQAKTDRSRQAPGPPAEAAGQTLAWVPSRGAVREVIESVAVALILAFLFRTFEAEAFVIPTGSMAPTLLGRHKDVVCEKCGYRFEISASEEVDERTGRLRSKEEMIEGAVCPMCGHAMHWSDQPHSHPAMKGDRILVGKFVYQLAKPERWDVVVFKFPGEASTNFIKRLVGLPDETIRIHHGDVFVKPADQEEFHIARKPPDKLRAMLQPVFDNDLSPAIEAAGLPPRWGPVEGAPGWQRAEDGKSFHTDGSTPDEAWLRYEHRLPYPELWQLVESGRSLPEAEPPAQLIADTAAYNTGRRNGELDAPAVPLLGVHWVGDLALECTLDVKRAAGQVVFELVEGGRRFQCRIDLAAGRAEMGIDDRRMADFRPAAAVPINRPGRYRLLFANCDNQLVLWVDDEVVSFDAPTAYGELGNRVPSRADLAPVGIGSAGAAAEVSRLKVYRDIYYIATNRSSGNGLPSDYLTSSFPDLADPSSWYVLRNYMRRVEFRLDADQFLVLGDNSPKSKDSRIWSSEGHNLHHYVSRELLIGKAFVIFWPDTKYKLPLPGLPFSLPYFPNFKEMGFVR